jgi:hypothetical protein
MIRIYSLSPLTLDAVLQRCELTLRTEGVFGLLRLINDRTPYRFTGIYRFEREWVKNVWLYDRQCPDVQHGSDVLWDASYCRITSTDGDWFEIADSQHDPRLSSHPAREIVRSYLAVVLRDSRGNAWGTMCHYDLQQHVRPLGALEELCAVRPLIEQTIRNEILRSA